MQECVRRYNLIVQTSYLGLLLQDVELFSSNEQERVLFRVAMADSDNVICQMILSYDSKFVVS